MQTKPLLINTRALIAALLLLGILSSAFRADYPSIVSAIFPVLNLDDNTSSWGVFTEVPTKGTPPPTWQLNNVSTPSLDGRSLRCALTGGNPYSNVHCYRNLPADPASNVFILSMSFFYQPPSTFNNVGGPSIVQALEFTMNKWDKGLRYEWALQWDNVDPGAPKWRYWGRGTPTGPLDWFDLGITGSLAGGQWHTLQLKGEILAGKVHYKRFSIDGQEHLLNISVSPDVTNEQDKLAVAIQLDGNSTETPYEVFLDQVAFRHLTGEDTTGVFRPSNGLLYLKNSHNTGFADIAINYGIPGDYPVVGDWDGDGTVTIGIYRNGKFYLRNSNTVGFADIIVPFGNLGDQPIAGDWNGDGLDTIGTYRPSTGQFLLRNSNTVGVADIGFYLGNAGDVGIAGDWDGDGIDTTGVFRPSNGVIFLKNTNDTGFADIALNYGIPGDKPVTGDWDEDGIDTIGVFRNGTFYLRNSNTVGFADISFSLGNPEDMPIAGDWDGLPYISTLPTLVEKAKDDLAQRLSTPINLIGVVQAKEVVWSDTSLGCPQPEMYYAQVLLSGYLILLDVGNIQYEYHADLGSRVLYCENPRPPVLGISGK
jgi:hypothetical protein